MKTGNVGFFILHHFGPSANSQIQLGTNVFVMFICIWYIHFKIKLLFEFLKEEVSRVPILHFKSLMTI